MLPLRDTVLFPNSFMPLAVAREASVRLIDEATTSGRMIGVFTQREAVGRGAAARRPLSHRHRHAHSQDVQAAGRQPAADRAGARPRAARPHRADASVPARRGHRGRREPARRGPPRDRRAAAEHQEQLPAGRVAVAAAVRRSAGAVGQHHRSGQARRLHRLEPDDDRHAGETGGARHARHPRADGFAQPDPDQGARGPRARLEDPVAGAVRGRQEPARILPPRAAQGDSEGARRRGRAGQGDRRAPREDRRRWHAGRGQERGAARARSAVEDAGGGGGIHRVADLHGLDRRAAVGQAHRGFHRSAAGPRRCSTPITPGSKR